MIVLVGSQKGGCGKSTLAVNIAGELAHQGKDVCLVDADQQQSALKWTQYREEISNVPNVHSVSASGNITKTLKDLGKRYEYIVCDVAGRDSSELRSGMVASDIVICPMRPSQFDLDTIPHFTDVFLAAKDFNTELNGLIVLNLCPTLPTIKEADQAETLITEINELSISPIRIHDRKAYRDAVSDGFCVKEWKDLKAAQEIEWLVKEILR